MGKRKIILIAFADSRLSISADRFKNQALDLNFFDEILIHNEKTIPSEFWKIFRYQKFEGERGYGYWSWKPYLVNFHLNQLNEKDILLYMDIGCHINKGGINKLNEYITRLENSKDFILGFESLHCQLSYTKRDLLIKLKSTKVSDLEKNQIIASLFFIKKTDLSIKFSQEWLDIFIYHWRLIDDSSSKSPNFPGYVENRHDQSVFSLLCYKYNQKLNFPEFRVWRNEPLELINENEPFIVARDKKLSFQRRLKNKIEKLRKFFLLRYARLSSL
jgi:hypothetical protein